MQDGTPPHPALPVSVFGLIVFFLGGLGAGDMKNGRCKFSILHHMIYFRCSGPKGKSADQNRERSMDWNKKTRDPLAAAVRDLLKRRYESKFFRLHNNVQNAEVKAEMRHKILV